jgi:hypothetical protein
MKRELTASIVFSSMTAFDMLRNQFFMVFHMIPRLIQGSVSLKRLQEYLYDVSISTPFPNFSCLFFPISTLLLPSVYFANIFP